MVQPGVVRLRVEEGNRRKIGGQATIAIGGHGSLAGGELLSEAGTERAIIDGAPNMQQQIGAWMPVSALATAPKTRRLPNAASTLPTRTSNLATVPDSSGVPVERLFTHAP
jgi:hypothetical protein